MSEPNRRMPGTPSRSTTKIIIALAACAFLWLSFASKIPTSSDQGDKTKSFLEHVETPRAKTVLIGGKTIVRTAFVGCKERDDINRIKSLALEGDREAAIKYAHQHLCVAFDKGEVRGVEDLSGWSGTACIRKAGDPECYWFPTPFLEAYEKASDHRSNRKPSGYATGGTYACADFEDIKALYDSMTSGSSSPADIFAKAKRSCIQMGDGWPVSILETTDDGRYARIESPGNFESQLWTSRLSITSGNRNWGVK